MHRLRIAAFLAIFCPALVLMTGCYTAYGVISQKYNYDDDISFNIEKVEEGTNISNGSGSYYAKKGYKFVFLYTEFTNKANEKKKLNFNNFYLLDPKTQSKYKVEFAMLESGINIFGSLDSQIQKKDTKSRKIVFLFPKNEKAEMLSVNDQIYNIKYAQ